MFYLVSLQSIFIRKRQEVSRLTSISIIIFSLIISGCQNNNSQTHNQIENIMTDSTNAKLETAIFGSGCFWCTEAIYERVKGVYSVISGYSGGSVENPAYKEVCEGTTGHAECIKIKFNPEEISYDELLEIFWRTHDPTTLNRQGNDVGTQYRSVIFYVNVEQRKKAEYYKQKLTEEKIWQNPIVTEITKFEKFYPAEDYHQDFYENNPGQGYCAFVITPKVEKFEKIFKDKLK